MAVSTHVLVLVSLAVALALTGCPRAGEELGSAVPGAPDSLTPGQTPADAAESDDERRRELVAWLQSDLDGDGASNELELDFGLDPEDPTDGPDIDGDEILNYRDDDVDGDDVFNLIDTDIDGDAIPNSVDFDIDADGIRNKWDWDSDSDGDDGDDDDDEEDEEEDEDKKDDEKDEETKEEEEDEELKEKYAQMAAWVDELFGDEDDDDDEELREKYARMADWVENVFGDGDSEDGEEGPQTGPSDPTRFAVTVESLVQRAQDGDASAKKELRRLLLGIDVGLLLPLDPDSEEANRILRDLARRFAWEDLSTDDMRGYVERLQELSRPTGDDASETYDALFQQVTDIPNPRSSGADEELDIRINSIERLAGELADVGLPETSKAVSDLAAMLGDEPLDEKVDGVVDLAGEIDDPDLGNIVGALEQLTQTLEQLQVDWDWDAAIESLKNLPGIEDGIDSDEVQEAAEDVADGP